MDESTSYCVILCSVDGPYVHPGFPLGIPNELNGTAPPTAPHAVCRSIVRIWSSSFRDVGHQMDPPRSKPNICLSTLVLFWVRVANSPGNLCLRSPANNCRGCSRLGAIVCPLNSDCDTARICCFHCLQSGHQLTRISFDSGSSKREFDLVPCCAIYFSRASDPRISDYGDLWLRATALRCPFESGNPYSHPCYFR